MKRKIWFASGTIILVFCSLLLFDIVSPNEAVTARQECAVCGLWTEQYEQTRHVLILKNGKKEHFCSFACAAKGIEANKANIRGIKAADFVSRKLIDADKAFYLEGSNIPGVMSYISRSAFASKQEVEKFQRQYGGKIVTLRQALRE